jgi:hypothetical protein
MIISGAVFIGSAAFYFWPATPDEGAAIARLSELGWTVKRSPEGIQFEIADRSLPSMKDSAVFFRQLTTPFRLTFQRVNGLEGLHHLFDIGGCTKIEILTGEFTDISELSGFTHLTHLTIGQLPLNRFGTVDASPLSSLTNLEDLVLSSTRIRDIKFLENFKKLRKLIIGKTLVANSTPVSGLSLLEDLDIRGTRIEELKPINDDQSLKALMIGDEKIPSLGNLTKLSNFARLSIIGQHNLNLKPVGLLTQLESLWIWCGQAR